ncbi:DUF1924 domain-containing protein [Roseospirillum parvum]|uniref:Cytochrome c domain-containing protein n=1 Tax=Roseospirillum parvum TaxID=83401 RepID=A0A1G8AIS8_9PROT|nr:DUF1924 domain-containing protein [Roseospirillum parvum]SDH20838.1 protein of unknown function [Roseospirillum parvum]
MFQRTLAGLIGLATASGLGLSPALADPAAERSAILDTLAKEAKAEDPGFAGFSAQRGETLYMTEWSPGSKTPACATCHTTDPRQQGRNAKTGRPIEPMAVSAKPDRFTDPDEVAKQFRRDCDKVLGRACTATEKGDYITFLAGQ